MSRAEHLTWAKQRALDELGPGGGGPATAMASITSDLSKHPETAGHSGLELMMVLALGGHMRTSQQVREFVDGIQ